MVSNEHFVNFPPAGLSLLLKHFAPSNLADTFKTGLSERKTWQLRDAKCDIIQTGLNQSSQHEGEAAREKNGECISYEYEVNKRIES